MNAYVTLVGLMSISLPLYCDDSITIKGINLGMNVEDASLVLAKAFEIDPKEFDNVRVTVDGVEKICIFTPGFNAEFKDTEDGLKYCNMLVNNINLSMIVLQQDFQKNILKNIKKEIGDEVSDGPIRQAAPLATFIDNELVTLMFDSDITEQLFSYNKGDFKVFAKGFIDAYGIPSVTPGDCVYINSNSCWDYNSPTGTFVSLFDFDNKSHKAPIIIMYKNPKPTMFNF